MLRDHGQAKKYYHDVEGYNGRLDALQAGFLTVKLAHLATWNEQRQEHAAEYGRLFAEKNIDLVVPYEPFWSRAVYHLYVVRVKVRDGLMKSLKDAGIGTGIHYPVPLHLQKAYQSLGYERGDFSVCERVAETVVSLPMYPQLTAEQQGRTVREIVMFLNNEAAPKTALGESVDMALVERPA